MIYLKTILSTLFITLLLASELFISYNNIQYSNIILIFFPIAFCIIVYLLLCYLNIKAVNLKFTTVKFNPAISVLLMILCVIFQMASFSLESFLELNFLEIRENFIERTPTLGEQLVPLFLVYPLIHFTLIFSKKEGYFNATSIFILIALMFIGFTTGGRQIFMQILLLMVFLKGKALVTNPRNILFISLFVLAASVVTIGRYEKENFDKVIFVETLMPANVNPILIKSNESEFYKDIFLEFSFYFGHQIPGFCNKVNNIDWQWLPKYLWAMQPFLERQLIKAGILNYSQEERYDNFKALADNTGFFDVSWSTGFLDIYYNLSIVGSILFFILVPLLLYNTEQSRLLKPDDVKYKILTAFNLLFIITFFMTPAFSDTTIFFSYLILYVIKPVSA